MTAVRDRLEAPAYPTGNPGVRRPAWVRSLCAGAALLLAGAPVGAVVEGGAWAVHAAAVVALVVGVGIVAEVVVGVGVGDGVGRIGAAGVAVAQLTALALALTGRFAPSGVAGFLPGPTAVGELGDLVTQAATQIRTGVAPVPATPAMLLLVSGAFGLTAVAVHAVAVGARAPAVAGVLLLAVFAVPTALADDLMPVWMIAAAGAGFGLLLLSGPVARSARRAPLGVALTAAAVVAALGVGAAATGVGTAGRFGDGGAGTGRSADIGLSPFTALRGQLQQGVPTPLFRVTGLPRPTYLRALTLSSYVPGSGWQPSRPGAGSPLSTSLPATGVPGERVRVAVENLGFRDYWLPLFGVPLGVDGVADDRWAFDATSGTAYSTRPRREEAWTQDALLPAPPADLLRTGDGSGVDALFLDTDGIDPRVAALARQVTADAPTGFDRAVALNQWFTGPDSAFRYDLATAPGNDDDAMVDFLTRGRRGYCEQFASSMAAMLRTVGVPARVAVGFTGGRADGAGSDDARTVSTTDAHAWVESWFPGVGWTTFDPTPLTDGRTVVPPYVAEAVGEAAARPTEAAAPTVEAAPTPAAPTAAPDTAEPPPATPDPPVDPDVPAAADPVAPVVLRTLLGVLVAGLVGLAVAAPSLWRARLRRRRVAAAVAGGPGAADAAWAELLAESADRGVAGRATDTVRGTARRLVDGHGLDGRAREAVDAVVGVVEESWYGGVDPAPDVLGGPVHAALAGIRAGSPLGLRGRLLPSSVVDAVRPRRAGGSRADGPADLDDLDDLDDDAAATARH